MNAEKKTLRVALAQFFVQEAPEENLALVRRIMHEAAAKKADILVLPEGILARKPSDSGWSAAHAESVSGPFITAMKAMTAEPEMKDLLVVFTVLTKEAPSDERAENNLFAVRNGEAELVYAKLHLYDAFSGCESSRVKPGSRLPGLVKAGGFLVGFMTCYDIRFPELARSIALRGADIIIVPSAWVKGPLKEMHWDLCIRSRALENTVYVAAVSESGPVNIGCSKISDPFGAVVAQCGPSDELLVAELDMTRVAAAKEALPVLKNRRFRDPELR